MKIGYSDHVCGGLIQECVGEFISSDFHFFLWFSIMPKRKKLLHSIMASIYRLFFSLIFLTFSTIAVLTSYSFNESNEHDCEAIETSTPVNDLSGAFLRISSNYPAMIIIVVMYIQYVLLKYWMKRMLQRFIVATIISMEFQINNRLHSQQV